MKKYMKFPMFKKETEDKKYHNDPFRAVNFKRNEDGDLICPMEKDFCFLIEKMYEGISMAGKKKYIPVRTAVGVLMLNNAKRLTKIEVSG